MPERISRGEINSMIKTCIRTVKEGKIRVSDAQAKHFSGLLEAARRSEVIPREPETHKVFLADSPMGFLMDAVNLGLVTKRSHLEFAAGARWLIKAESSIFSLYHRYPREIREVEASLTGKPTEIRLQMLSGVLGVDFTKVINLGFKAAQTHNRARFERGIARRQTLKAQAERLDSEWRKESGRVYETIRERVDEKFARPDAMARLRKALKISRDEFRQRDQEKIVRYLEAAER